jgi:hypothetical protein
MTLRLAFVAVSLFPFAFSLAEGPAAQGSEPRAVLDRFLAAPDSSLVRYSALRRLTATSRGGKMQASLTARTTLDPERGFQFEVIEESGSKIIRSKVLHGALEAEQRARQREEAARAALTVANYEFTLGHTSPAEAGMVRVEIRPRRKDTMLIEGSILLSATADLVRIEGLLVKRPSFWTRRVEVVRRYARVSGVRVPIEMSSTADVLVAGKSTFMMEYTYESINGTPVQLEHETGSREKINEQEKGKKQ